MNEAQLAARDAAEREDGPSLAERVGRETDPVLWAMMDLRRAIWLECSKVLGSALVNSDKLDIVHEITAPRNFRHPGLAVARLRRMADDETFWTPSGRAHFAVASDAFEDAAKVIAGVKAPTGEPEPTTEREAAGSTHPEGT